MSGSPDSFRASVEALFNPRSVAIVGASADPGKWGYQYAKALLRGANRRHVWLVNTRQAVILGEQSYARCTELPSAPDLAVICVPAEHVEVAVRDALDSGAKYILCVTAGFAETGTEGTGRQDRLTEMVRSGGARLVGPNCLGLYDADAEFECLAFWETFAGSVGLVSQSGTVLLELGTRLRDWGLGLSRAVSIGNQADLTTAEYLHSFAGSDATKVAIVYIEQLREGRALFSALEMLQSSGRPCILLAPGANEATTRAVASHTGSMLTADDLIDATCEDIGVIRVRSVMEAVRATRGLLAPTRPKGIRVAVVADGGGAAVLGADACVRAGLHLPSFSLGLQERIAASLQPGAAIQNPVDTVGALCLTDMQAAIEEILASDEVDSVLLAGVLNNVDRVTDDQDRQTATSILAAAHGAGKGLAVSSMLPAEIAVAELSRLGVPVSVDPVEAAEMLAASQIRSARRLLPTNQTLAAGHVADRSYFGARRLFSGAGITFPKAFEIRTEAEALAATEKTGFPVVLKALGTLHKSDQGGVRVGIADARELVACIHDFEERLRPPSMSIEEMAPPGVELIVGGVRDPAVGPVVLVGAGGVLAELLADRVAALAPVSPDYVRGMLLRLRAAELLIGYRGEPAADIDAAAHIISRFSELVMTLPDVAEAEMNPLRVYQAGCLALDARLVMREDAA